MLDRQEDKKVRMISKKANLDSIIDDDSGDEEYYPSLLADLTKSSCTLPEEQERRSRTPDVRPIASDTETMPVPATHAVKSMTAPASVGSALRRNTDGSVAAPKVLPKRNEGSKVSKNLCLLPNRLLTLASSSATELEAKAKRADTPSGI
jgi:hypothetical protein